MTAPFRPRGYVEEPQWDHVYHTDSSALMAIFFDKKIDQDDWARAIARSAATGFPTEHGGAAWTPEMRILSAIFALLKPKIAVEVGVAKGLSLRAEREFHMPEKHFAFDVVPSFGANVPEGVNFWVNDGSQAIPALPPFDVAFLDDGHSGGFTRRWLERLHGMSRPGSVVVVHDMRVESTGGDDREAVVDFLTAHDDEWRGFELRTPCGMAILRKAE